MRAVFVGGSSGIGLAAARRAVEAGWDVVVASRDPTRADVDCERISVVLPVDGGHRLAAP